jgi:hypothetical protein
VGGPECHDRRHRPPGRRSARTTCRTPRGGSAAVVGAFVYLVGGADEADPRSTRCGQLAPKRPFFQLGLIGATIPGLAIPGQIGIQLGEINAATIATINFIVLLTVGVLVQRPRTRARWLHAITRGRTKLPPPEDELDLDATRKVY